MKIPWTETHQIKSDFRPIPVNILATWQAEKFSGGENELDSMNQAMERAGYTVRGENGISNRRYFTKGENQRSHHIHAFTTGDAQIIKHLAFRDYLIRNNDIATQYALMKKNAVLLCDNDTHRYSIYKADFIQKHLRMALIDAGHLS